MEVSLLRDLLECSNINLYSKSLISNLSNILKLLNKWSDIDVESSLILSEFSEIQTQLNLIEISKESVINDLRYKMVLELDKQIQLLSKVLEKYRQLEVEFQSLDYKVTKRCTGLKLNELSKVENQLLLLSEQISNSLYIKYIQELSRKQDLYRNIDLEVTSSSWVDEWCTFDYRVDLISEINDIKSIIDMIKALEPV